MSTDFDIHLTQGAQSLAAALEELKRWIAGEHVYPLDPGKGRALESARHELDVQVRQWQADPSLLTIVFLGGTGVGKSTLLNALAGSSIAESSMVRPTTQHPTVYLHEAVDASKLDPLLQRSRTVTHERESLRQKILIDTPDMDGNVKEHRDRLCEVLPLADAVLYIGSQEKYHDQKVWELLLEHRKSKGFAFILNKWDRCSEYVNEETGDSPEADFRRSLTEAGFASPIIFRTCARQWLNGRDDPEKHEDDFERLEEWLRAGLNELAVRDIKMRGMGAKIDLLSDQLAAVIPPDWTRHNQQLKRLWKDALREGLGDHAQILVQAADKQATSLESHFSRLGRGKFTGLFGLYLRAIDYLSRLRLTPNPLKLAPPDLSSMDALAARVVQTIPSDIRETKLQSMKSHLLALADKEGWPIQTLEPLLPDAREQTLSDASLAAAVKAELRTLEQEFSDPTGGAYARRVIVKGLCDWLPYVVVALLVFKVFYDGFFHFDWIGITDLFSMALFLLLTLFGLHILLSKMVPVAWHVLRIRFREQVEQRLLDDLSPYYLKTLDDFTARVAGERATPTAALDVLQTLQKQMKRSQARGEQASLFPVSMK